MNYRKQGYYVRDYRSGQSYYIVKGIRLVDNIYI